MVIGQAQWLIRCVHAFRRSLFQDKEASHHVYSGAMVALLVAVASFAQVVYVSPTGNDAGSGSASAPKKTIRAAISQLAGSTGGTVRLLAGAYLLPETIAIGHECPGLTLEGAPGQKATLLGGVDVRGWQKAGRLLWAAVPDRVAAEGARMLMVNGQLRPRSRMPETGEFIHQSVFDVPWMSTTGGGWKRKPTDAELTTMKCRPSDIGPWLDPVSAEITVFHMWDESCVGVQSVDLNSGVVRFSSPCGHPPGAFDVHKYVVWNTSAGLTKPGQWFLDRRAKKLLYWPMPGESPGRLRAHLPTMNVLVNLSGVADLTLRNLELRVANVPLKAGGFGAGDYDGAITAANCPRLKCEKLSVQAVAGTGIKLWNCVGATVDHCQTLDTGAGGIRVDSDESVVQDCTVRRVGLQYPSAIGLWVAGKNSVAAHNEITDTSYSAIVGAGEGHLIADNYIARAMLTMHDGGGIYFGFVGHVTLRDNLVEQIADTGGYGASSYYLDEQAHDCVVERNVSIGVVRPSQNHMARQNTIEGNLFVNRGDMRMDFARCQAYTIRNNVLDCPGKLELRLAPDGAASIEGNIFGTDAGVIRVTLDQYAEKGRQPLPRTGNQFQRPDVKELRKRVWQVTDASGKTKVWDMSHVGPR